MAGVTTASPRLCKATKADGSPCQAYRQHGSEFCYMHDPDRAAERKQAQARGGRARHDRVLFEDEPEAVAIGEMSDVVGVLEAALNATLRLENSVARNRAIGYLAGTAIKAIEYAELEDRVEALEKAVNDGNKTNAGPFRELYGRSN